MKASKQRQVEISQYFMVFNVSNVAQADKLDYIGHRNSFCDQTHVGTIRLGCGPAFSEIFNECPWDHNQSTLFPKFQCPIRRLVPVPYHATVLFIIPLLVPSSIMIYK